MPDQATETAPARPGRCVNHPGIDSVGSCDVCGRSLCVACLVPVRGSTIGRECLPTVLEDAPPSDAPAVPLLPRGDLLAVIGFGLVVAASVFPWSRFGNDSGIMQAWTLHWSLLSVVVATVGFLFALASWRRPRDPRPEASVYAASGLISLTGALLHYHHPPPLSAPSAFPIVAVAGAALALAGAMRKAWSLRRAKRRIFDSGA